MHRQFGGIFVVILVVGTACGGGNGGSGSLSPTAPTTGSASTTTASSTTGTSPYGACAVTAASAAQTPSFTVQVIPLGDPLHGVFYKCIKVFGMSLLATESFPNDRLVWVATIAAEYLDNDEDGQPDDAAVNAALVNGHASMLLAQSEGESKVVGQHPSLDYMEHKQPQGADESTPNGSLGRGDASLEEVLHLIQNGGYGPAHPNLDPGNGNTYNLLTDAMDIARSGRFKIPPVPYPAAAWYSYDDASCDYACMAVEYFYWGLTTQLGGQGDFRASRCREIQNEWKPCTKAEFQTTDTKLYALLTNPAYNLPTRLPNGRYR